MKAGPLRHFVTFEELAWTLDSDGAQVEDWVPAFDGQMISASIAPVSGNEFIAAAATQAKVNTRIAIRYRPGLTESMRVVHRGEFYDIRAILPDKDSGFEYVTLMCQSGVSPG